MPCMCSRDIKTSFVCTSGVKEWPEPATRICRLSLLQALIICTSASIPAGLATCCGLHCTDPDQLCQGLTCEISIVVSPLFFVYSSRFGGTTLPVGPRAVWRGRVRLVLPLWPPSVSPIGYPPPSSHPLASAPHDTPCPLPPP